MNISFFLWTQVIQFLYSGKINPKSCNLTEVKQVSLDSEFILFVTTSIQMLLGQVDGNQSKQARRVSRSN